MYTETGRGQLFILHGNQAYAVTLDHDGGNWRLSVPGDPSQLGQRVMRDARGEWQMREDIVLPRIVRPPGDRVARSDTKDRERAATYMLTHRQTTDEAAAHTLKLPVGMMREVAADVDAVRHAWQAATASGVIAQVPADMLLTPAEKAFVNRWAGALSASNFAELMRYPQQKIDAYLQSAEHRGTIAASSLQQASGADEGVAEGADVSGDSGGFRSLITPEKRTRILRMLSSNPSMSYSAIAAACQSSPATVSALAREHDLQRSNRSLTADSRSGLLDDFILFPETRLRDLAQQYGVPLKWVQALRREFAPIRANWNAVHHDDIANNRAELYASLPDGAKPFIRQWGATLSATTLAIVTKMPASAIDAYMRSAEYRQLTAAVSPPASSSPLAPEPESASTQRPASPQPGPSAPHSSLTDVQKELVIEWAAQGMRPDSLSRYLSMLAHAEVPQATIEAFLASPEHQRKVHDSQPR